VVIGLADWRLFLAEIAGFARGGRDRACGNDPDLGSMFADPRSKSKTLPVERLGIGEHDVDNV